MKLLIAAMLISANLASAAEIDSDNFPFQDKSVAFRFQQGFFDLAAQLLESILKKTGTVGADNKIIIERDDPKGRNHFLEYEKFAARFLLEEGRLSANAFIRIKDSRFYIEDTGKCSIQIRGTLQFVLRVKIKPTGAAEINLVDDKYDDSKLKISDKDCGVFTSIGIGLFVRNKLESKIQELFWSLFNEKELRVVEQLELGKTLEEQKVFINQPFQDLTEHPERLVPASSALNLNLGILGHLSNATESDQVRITNPGLPYLNNLGFDWTFDAGLQAVSQNLFDATYRAATSDVPGSVPDWGLGPYNKTGRPIDFDAGLIIKESFLVSLFENLYQAGFFNLQLQESLLNPQTPEDFSISPFGLKKDFHIALPNGRPLTKENFKDARVELQFQSPPSVAFSGDNQIRLIVPQFSMGYYYKADGVNGEVPIVKFKARFKLLAEIVFGEGGRLFFKFNEQPIEDFEILERTSIRRDVKDTEIRSELDRLVREVLSKVDVKIPLLDDVALELKYLGVDANPNNATDKNLSIYLKALTGQNSTAASFPQ